MDFDYQKYNFRDDIKYRHLARKGLDEDIVRTISEIKGEPQWMLDYRLKALGIYKEAGFEVLSVEVLVVKKL